METYKDRQKKIMQVSKRLLIFAGISLGITAIVFIPTFFFDYHFFISWLCFECGIIGGFVSIQQRLKKVGKDELTLLSESWASILLVPVYGGIFALVLYILFLSGLIRGDLFPHFEVPVFNNPVSTEDIKKLLSETYPQNGQDFAKFIFWSFLAGFSERFVPQIIKNVAKPSNEEDK